MMKPRNLAFYSSVVVIFIIVSFFSPYQTQVYSSIAVGFAVAVLISISMILFRGFRLLDSIFIVGILFLVIALLQSDLPTRAVVENFRHFSLILSVALTGLYVAMEIIQSTHIKIQSRSIQNFSNFFSVCSTTLSSELCSCLHPTLFLETMGILVFLPNQVRLGFVIMMTTLVNQIRVTYNFYKSKSHIRNARKREKS